MRVLILSAFVAFGFGTTVLAQDLSVAPPIIRSQEEALARDDAAAAYALAAPAIQRLFGGPDAFIAMVRQGYAPVYRHRRFDFGAAHAANGTVVQEVQIIDAEGEAWDAVYTLEQQPDGMWKISGCALSKAVRA